MKSFYRHLPNIYSEFVWEIDENQATGTIGLLKVAVTVNPSLIHPAYRAWMPSRPMITATGDTPGLAIGALLEIPSVKLAWNSERLHRLQQQGQPRPVPAAPSPQEQERADVKWWIFDTIFGGIVAITIFYWLWR